MPHCPLVAGLWAAFSLPCRGPWAGIPAAVYPKVRQQSSPVHLHTPDGYPEITAGKPLCLDLVGGGRIDLLQTADRQPEGALRYLRLPIGNLYRYISLFPLREGINRLSLNPLSTHLLHGVRKSGVIQTTWVPRREGMNTARLSPKPHVREDPLPVPLQPLPGYRLLPVRSTGLRCREHRPAS